MALGIQGMDYNANPFTSIVCINQESAIPESEGGPRPRKPSLEEQRYTQLEDEMQLEKQRHQQLHEDRVKATTEELEDSDVFIQENAGKVPKKTPEMEASDRRIQGLPPRNGGNVTS
jgi:hypothetical protein